MRTLTPLILIVIALAGTAYRPTGAIAQIGQATVDRPCGPLGTAHMRTTLYFGLSRPSGSISGSQWQSFLRTEVTPRFPDGLTVWEADGQWRGSGGHISRERAKVLLLVHDETPAVRAALSAIVQAYKKSFQQDSVLWETAPVCAAF
jgi:hypothetical protein